MFSPQSKSSIYTSWKNHFISNYKIQDDELDNFTRIVLGLLEDGNIYYTPDQKVVISKEIKLSENYEVAFFVADYMRQVWRAKLEVLTFYTLKPTVRFVGNTGIIASYEPQRIPPGIIQCAAQYMFRF